MSMLSERSRSIPPPPPPIEDGSQLSVEYGNMANTYSNNHMADDESVEAQHVVYTFAEEGKSSKKGRKKCAWLAMTSFVLLGAIIALGVVYGTQRNNRNDSTITEANQATEDGLGDTEETDDLFSNSTIVDLNEDLYNSPELDGNATDVGDELDGDETTPAGDGVVDGSSTTTDAVTGTDGTTTDGTTTDGTTPGTDNTTPDGPTNTSTSPPTTTGTTSGTSSGTTSGTTSGTSSGTRGSGIGPSGQGGPGRFQGQGGSQGGQGGQGGFQGGQGGQGGFQGGQGGQGGFQGGQGGQGGFQGGQGGQGGFQGGQGGQGGFQGGQGGQGGFQGGQGGQGGFQGGNRPRPNQGAAGFQVVNNQQAIGRTQESDNVFGV